MRALHKRSTHFIIMHNPENLQSMKHPQAAASFRELASNKRAKNFRIIRCEADSP